MKKLFTVSIFFLFFCIQFNAVAGERVVLVERFTSSTCGPCATNNPLMQSFLNSLDPDKYVSLAWHMNWPSPGNDPMYAYNVSDNSTRRTYYGVNSIPQGYMDGSTPITDYNPSILNSVYALRKDSLSPVTLIVRDSVVGDQMFVKITLYCETALSSTQVNLQVMVAEKLITYTSPPGTNGERIFSDVSRRGIPSAAGTNINIYPGHVYNYTYQTTIDPLWQPSQRRPVVFVQAGNKEILNAGTTLSNFSLLPIQGVKSVPAGSSQSANFNISVPYVAEGYNSPITLTAEVMGAPAGVTTSFNSGNTISTYPGNAVLTVNSSASVPVGLYKVLVTATNTNGKVHKAVVNYLIGQVYASVGTNPATLTFTANSVTYTGGKLLLLNTGSNLIISTTSPQGSTQSRYVFQNWSNGSTSLSQSIPVTNDLGDITANFQLQYKLSGLVNPPGLPVTFTGANDYYNAGANQNFSITPSVQYNGKTYYFNHWASSSPGGYTGPNNNATVTMNNYILQLANYDTVDVGVHNIGTEIPAEFSLFQNFPNPFNPETKIRFDLPKSAYTSIKIYDNMGREVSQLVNQSLAAGRYEYQLNASSFATGIYFYEIQAGEFRQIKKMMVVK